MSESKRKRSLQDPTVDLSRALSCLQALKENLVGIEGTNETEDGLGTLTEAFLELESAAVCYLRWNPSICFSFRNGCIFPTGSLTHHVNFIN